MDLIEFTCPTCQTTLSVPREAADVSGPCPTCGEIISGPGLKPPPEEDPPPPESAALPDQSPAQEDELDRPPLSPSSSDPTPQQLPPPQLPTNEGTTRLGLAPVALIALSSIAIAFFLGFLAGKSSVAAPSPPVTEAATDPADTTDQVIADKELPTVDPPEASPAPAQESLPVSNSSPTEETVSAAQTTLNAFLSAPDWSSRLVHVLHPDHVAPRMEELAQQKGDGPIPYLELEAVGLNRPDAEIFDLKTEKHPEGIPVAVQKVDDQWGVDWEAFAEFYYDAFRVFAENADGYEGIFRVQVTPVSDAPGEFLLSPPTPGQQYSARAKPESSVLKQINPVINFYQKDSPEEFEMLMNRGGVNFTLKLSRQVVEGEPLLQIEEVIAANWAPRAP